MTLRLPWLIGIGDSGYHLILDILRSLLLRLGVVDEGSHNPCWAQRWDDQQKSFPQRTVRGRSKEIFDNYKVRRCSHPYIHAFPPFGGGDPVLLKGISCGENLGLGWHPQIGDLIELMDGLVNLCIVVTYRSPQSRVRGTLRSCFLIDFRLECESAKAIHLYVTDEVRNLAPEDYRRPHYDDFLANPDAHLRALGEWWEVDSQILRGAGSRIRKPSQGDCLTPEESAFLDNYFSDENVPRWWDGFQTNPVVIL